MTTPPACQTPLIDLLRNVPLDARLSYKHSPTDYQMIPVGRLCHEAAAALIAPLPAPNWQPVPPRARIKPTHEAADAFWKYWRENGETHKHGYYESTWGAINKALAHGWDAAAAPLPQPPETRYTVETIRDDKAPMKSHYRVTDAKTDSRIATCYMREHADMIVTALNRGTESDLTARPAPPNMLIKRSEWRSLSPGAQAKLESLTVGPAIDEYLREQARLRAKIIDKPLTEPPIEARPVPTPSAWQRLYETVNELMAYLGKHGEITAQGDRASAVMDALHAIDGGVMLEWKLVPIKPTPAMLSAIRFDAEPAVHGGDYHTDYVRTVDEDAANARKWAAMLGAAPQAPEPGEA